MTRRSRHALGALIALVASIALPAAALAASGSSGTSATRTFSAPAYVDYHGIGGEPTVIVDRYPFPGTSSDPAAQCPAGQASCFKDLSYVSNPLGVPSWSAFYKSTDLGATFRLGQHEPSTGHPSATGPGGGDSHQAVGAVTHRVFFVDLSGACVTMNTSSDLGESFTPDPLGCGVNPGAIDDRQWVATDETAPASSGGNVYVSFNDDTSPAPTLALARSTHDGTAGTFATDSVCNLLTQQGGGTPNQPPAGPAPSDATPTPCPDPSDASLYVSGPIVSNQNGSSASYHDLYIPFVRAQSSAGGGTDYVLYVARSTDEATTWTRTKVADLGSHDPANIFPVLALDRAGNLYYTWSQDQSPGSSGEQDVYYTYSSDGGTTWAAPIDLTPERGDSAVFPWIVAGDRGQVDLVYYASNSGLNSNAAPPSAVWNVFFGQSENALNPGSNFSAKQISDRPNHYGGICTQGDNCGQANRDLLDFFTVDVDHLGAAEVTWADDDNSLHETRDLLSRQLSGNSVFSRQPIALRSAWPVKDHSTSDPAADVYDASGNPKGSCAGMDLLGTSAQRSGDMLTVTLSLNAPPTAAEAMSCGGATVNGGLWGAELWAPSPPASGNPQGNDNFYLAYRDNPLDGGPQVEAGTVNGFAATTFRYEFVRTEGGSLGGTCFAAPGVPATSRPCTITITASLAGLGVKTGGALDSLTGLSAYQHGSEQQVPFTTLGLGFSNQADAAAPFDISGSG